MKTAKDPRHISRIRAFEYLFSYFFNKGENVGLEKPSEEMSAKLVEGVLNNVEQIDKILNEIAPQWTVENMKLIDLTILRIGVLEGFIVKSVPINVAIDESIELAKRYGDENSPSFINGVLGALVNKE